MAGSLRWFAYTRDDGTVNGVFLDESNTELTNLSTDTNISAAGLEPLPKGISPRYVILSDLSGNINRKAVILSQARYSALDSATDFQLTATNNSGVSATYTVSPILKNAETIRRQPRAFDTGLNDGDNP